jgi:two-component system, NarL family, sensor histidine kinase EvgS
MKTVSRVCLADLNHGLRTPLNGILGFAQLLERENLSEEQLQMVRCIREAGHSLLGAMSEILTIPEHEYNQVLIGAPDEER